MSFTKYVSSKNAVGAHYLSYNFFSEVQFRSLYIKNLCLTKRKKRLYELRNVHSSALSDDIATIVNIFNKMFVF